MKRVKWLLLLCAFVFLWSSPGWAEDVAKIGDTGYATLQAAVTAAGTEEEKTIQLIANSEETGVTIPANAKIVLDLNGKTLKGKGLQNNGTLTVIDTAGGGIISSDHNGITTGSNSTLTLGAANSENKFTVKAQELAVGTLAKVTAATINIYGGTYTTVDNGVLMTNGTARDNASTTRGITWNIYGGTFNGNIQSSGYIACGIYAPQDDTWNIYGGTFKITNGAGIVARAGVINIPAESTVEFITTGNTTGKVGDKATSLNSSMFVFDASSPNYPGFTEQAKIDIKGGKFSSEAGIIHYIPTASETSTSKIVISGGAFSTDPTTYKATDAVVVPLSDNTYKYGVLSAAPTVAVTVAADPASNLTKTYDGSSFDLTATASPAQIASIDIAYTYAWTKGGTALEGATTNTYTVAGNVADNSTYNCTATIKESNYSNSGSATVAITKATITPTVTMTGWTYGTTASTPSVSGNTGSGDVTYTYATKGASDYAATVPTNAGDYTVKATVAESDNYEGGTATADFTIAKANATVDTAPTAKTLTYTGSAQALVEAGKATGGTLQYAVGTTAGTYGTEIPTGTDAGTYTVWYQVIGDSNHENFTAKSLTVTIDKATPTVTAPTAATGLTYNGSAQALVTAGTTTGGTLEYSTDGTNYSTSIPTGTNAGSYTVSYRVTGGTNYNDVAAASVTATIAKVAASEITTQVGGTTTGTATTTNGKTNTKTSKTTTFTLGSGTGASTMSADVAITTEEKLATRVGDTFSTVVAVDTVLNGNKDFNQYAYSMDIVGLPSWLTKTGELTSSDANADTAGKYHHEFTLSGTPTEVLADGKITFTALITLSGDNYANALKASADKSVEVTVTARPVPPVAPVLRIVDASEDKSLIITADVTNGSVTLSPDVVVEATAGTNFVWIVSGDLPKYLTATSTDKTLTISGSISDDLIAYSIVVIASNDVGSDSVKISFNVYKTETDESGAVIVTITSEDIEKIKETKGSDELTLSDIVDTTALNETLASSGGALKLSNGLTTLEGISDLSNLKTLDITEVATLTTKSLTADSLGSATEIKIGEKNTSITTVDLSGSKVETVTMQKSSVQTLTLGSSVKTVDAKDSANLTAIDFSQSTNVQSVNISGTQVASADLSNCTELVSFSFDVAPGGGTESAGALQTLKLPETSDKLENLAVRGNQLLWLSLGSSKYPNLKNINVRGQRRGGASIKMAFDFFEFLWNLYQQSLYENEADYEEYTEGAETPFDVAQISSDITYVASDDNSTQTATITNGKVNFIKTPKNFKYEYDTGFRRSGRTASTGSFITAEDEDEENGNMDVTIETGSVTGSAGGLESSSGGCDAGFSYGALSALMLVFATLKKRR